MLDMVKIKNCWTILKFYGYDIDLKLNLSDDETQIKDIKNYFSLKLSKKYKNFLIKIFSLFSSNKYWLNYNDICSIFDTLSTIHYKEFY